jgi:hypothetical protein
MRRVALALTAALVLPALARAQDADEHVMLDTTFTTGTNRLSVDLQDADLSVVTGGPGHVRVVISARAPTFAEGHEYFAAQHFRLVAEQDGITVSSEPDQRRWGSSNRGKSLRVRVTVPPTIDVNLATSDGDITVDDITGRISVSSADGDLTLGRLTGSSIALRTSDGDIDAKALDAQTVSVRTSDGDLDLGAVSGALTATTSDGDLRVTLVKPTSVQLETDDGDIRVAIPRGMGFDVDLSGEDLDTGGLAIQGQIARHHVTGTVGGGGVKLVARSRGGDVEVRE